MILQSIEIKNFRNIKKETVNAENINLIYGDNAQGKTSINKSINFLINCTENEKWADSIMKGETECEVKAQLFCKKTNKTLTVFQGLEIIEGREKPKSTFWYKWEGEKTEKTKSVIKDAIKIIDFNFKDILNSRTLMAKIDTKLEKDDFKSIENKEYFWDMFLKEYQTTLGFELLAKIEDSLYTERRIVGRSQTESEKYCKTRERELIELEASIVIGSETTQELDNMKEFALGQIAGLKTQLENIEETKANYIQKDAELQQTTDDLENCVNKIKNLEDLLKKQNLEKQRLDATVVEKTKALNEAKAKYKPDSEIKEKIAEQNEKLEYVKSKKAVYVQQLGLEQNKKDLAKKKDDTDKLKSLYKSMTEDIELIRYRIANHLIKRFDMNIEGLNFHGGEFFLNDIKISELSESEALKISFKILQRLQKDSSIVLFDGAEALDNKSYKELKGSLDEGKNYFITKVGDSYDTIDVGEQHLKMMKGRVAESKSGNSKNMPF